MKRSLQSQISYFCSYLAFLFIVKDFHAKLPHLKEILSSDTAQMSKNHLTMKSVDNTNSDVYARIHSGSTAGRGSIALDSVSALLRLAIQGIYLARTTQADIRSLQPKHSQHSLKSQAHPVHKIDKAVLSRRRSRCPSSRCAYSLESGKVGAETPASSEKTLGK